jgi:hypothetical protein
MPPYQNNPQAPVPLDEMSDDGRQYTPIAGRCYEIPDLSLVGRWAGEIPTPERPVVIQDDALPAHGPYYLGKYGLYMERADNTSQYTNRSFEHNSIRLFTNVGGGVDNVDWHMFIRQVPCHDDEPMEGGVRRVKNRRPRSHKSHKSRKNRNRNRKNKSRRLFL